MPDSNPPLRNIYTYDHSPAVVSTHSWRTVANSAAYVIPVLRPDDADYAILDVGCGPGSITIDLAQRCPRARVVGLEPTEEPLARARAAAAAAGVANLTFATGDIHALPFPDDSFDLVHAHQVLQHVEDPVHALRELRRVCRAGGGVVAARDSDRLSWFPEDNAGIAAFVALDYKVRGASGGHPHCGRMLHAWARDAGFDLARVQRSAAAWCFSSPDERRYWGGSFGARARASGFVDTAVSGGFTTREELEEMARGWDRFVEDEDAWFGLLHAEILAWK
ncbi:hypothetical protein KEM52_002560 [Ascosphaera acerosa]|nr:hypothetical protein KEM52_002560 [Ascosphaera acerosa]